MTFQHLSIAVVTCLTCHFFDVSSRVLAMDGKFLYNGIQKARGWVGMVDTYLPT